MGADLAVRAFQAPQHASRISLAAAGAILLEQNDSFAVQRASSMTPETNAPLRADEIVGLPAVAA